MNPEVQEKFVTALRSGNFKQAKGTLCRKVVADYIREDPEAYKDDPDNSLGYCCLGVLSEIAVQENVIRKNNYDEGNGEIVTEYGIGEDTSYTYLPSPVAIWAGINGRDIFFDLTDTDFPSRVDVYKYHRQCAERRGKWILAASDLNDRYNYTFSQIADLIESGKMVSRPADLF